MATTKSKGATSVRKHSVAATTTAASKQAHKNNGGTQRKPAANKSNSRRSQASISKVRATNKPVNRNSNGTARRKRNEPAVANTGAALLSQYPLPREIATWNIWDAKAPKLFDGEPLVDEIAWTTHDTFAFGAMAFILILVGFALGQAL